MCSIIIGALKLKVSQTVQNGHFQSATEIESLGRL